MEEDQKWEEIDNYLLGRLSPEETTAFELRLTQDEQLRADVDLQRSVIEGMSLYNEKQQFIKMLDEVDLDEGEVEPEVETQESSQGQMTKGNARIRWLRPLIAVAASVAILFFAWIYFFQSPQINGPQLAETYFRLAEDKMSAQLGAQGMASDIPPAVRATGQAGMDAFVQGQGTLDIAKDSLTTFKNELRTQSYLSALSDFYLAQIAWTEADYDRSLALLLPLADMEDLPIEADIRYYLAMAYFSKNENELAISYLEDFPDDHPFSGIVQDIRNDLR